MIPVTFSLPLVNLQFVEHTLAELEPEFTVCSTIERYAIETYAY